MILRLVKLMKNAKFLLAKLLLLVGLIVIVRGVVDFTWPLLDRYGTITEGEYRGLEIGDSKRDVIRKTTLPNYYSKLQIVAYGGADNETVLVFSRSPSIHILDSDSWALYYPSIHKETIHLTFENGRLILMKYTRNMLAP